MADKDKIRKLSNIYILQCCGLFLVLHMATLMVSAHFGMDVLLAHPLSLASSFCIATGLIIGVLWRWVATSNEEMLTTFYASTNAFRMLLALAALTICYFVVGSENIKIYVIVFMAFYLIAVAHHAIYFARITNNK